MESCKQSIIARKVKEYYYRAQSKPLFHFIPYILPLFPIVFVSSDSVRNTEAKGEGNGTRETEMER